MSNWEEATRADPRLLRYSVRGPWWELLSSLDITLLVTREYEHLVLALSAPAASPRVSFLRIPHPSGMAVDHQRGIVHIASTRNPNQVFDCSAATSGATGVEPALVPTRTRFFPGHLYMHDLALIGGVLHANSVGQNAIVRLCGDQAKPVWWPRAIESPNGPIFHRNHLQLNSIAAGQTVEGSYFSASTETVSFRRPGHRNFPVDGRGVIFSGTTREPVARGLTRPHSARFHGDSLWVDNSGYGEVGVVRDQRFEPVVRLPGWTRGLYFHADIAFVGTSRVIPRFRQYAPGLDVDASVCGVHAINTRTGDTLASLLWPNGNQIFAIEAVPTTQAWGFPFTGSGTRALERDKNFFYQYKISREQDR